MEDLLENGEGNQEMLQAALDDANERLEELETCGNGGECRSREETVSELAVVTDAYCDWIFGCCTSDELVAAVSPAFNDADSCKAVHRSFLESGSGLSLNFDGTDLQRELRYVTENALYYASTISDRIERGRIALDTESLQECVSLIAAQGCADEQETCFDESEVVQACEGYVEGLQEDGEPCAGSGECADGLICDTDVYGSYFGGYGLALNMDGSDGKCVPAPEVDRPCANEGQCGTMDDNLYCDQQSGTCQERPSEGEACAFEDNLFFEGISESVPCQPGLTCGLTTKTCVAECDEDSRCYRHGDVDRECGEGLICNVTDNREGTGLNSSTGYCDQPFPKGKEATDPEECASGSIEAGACEGLGGEDCTVSDECRSQACESDVCVTYCGGDFSDACGDDEFCESSLRCRPTVGLGENCPSGQHEQCATGLCVAGTCQEPVDTGEACDGYDELCGLDDYCNFVEGNANACAPRLEEDASCSIGEARQCAEGLDCFEGTCLPLSGRDVGEVCTSRFQCASERCVQGLCAAGKAEGEDCNADPDDNGSVNTDIGIDECEAGLYCRRDNPTDPSDMSGTCTTQGAPGSVCDNGVQQGVPQCAGDFTCGYSNERQTDVCPVVYTEDDDPDSCLIYGFPFESETTSDSSPGDVLTPIEGPIAIQPL